MLVRTRRFRLKTLYKLLLLGNAGGPQQNIAPGLTASRHYDKRGGSSLTVRPKLDNVLLTSRPGRLRTKLRPKSPSLVLRVR